ncbi:MAG TPA: chemotaxis protein CheD [Chloroflexota bacterium]|nr:chemotaxis protein CheD [Chloroflexota bacterium]
MATSTVNSVPVGLGELHVAQEGELIAYSLGSCVAICLYDPVSRAAAMAHVVLPAAPASGPGATPGKFADTAVPALLEALLGVGASPTRLHCWLAGGAAVLPLGGGGSLPNIGQRNAEAARAALARARIAVRGEALGGNRGRTVRLLAGVGRVLVRTVSGPEVEL